MIKTGFEGDFHTKYHAFKIRERKDVRLLRKYIDKARREEAFARLREFDERLASIKTDIKSDTDAEFNRIIEGDTEKETPKDGPRHRYDRLTLGQRIYAWWCGHAF